MRFAASEPITNFLQRKENYQDLVGQATQERAAENAAISQAEGLVAGTGIQGKADIKSAKYGAAATRYAGQQAGNAAMFGGLMSGISGLAGGAISKYGNSYAGVGREKYGTMQDPMADIRRAGITGPIYE